MHSYFFFRFFFFFLGDFMFYWHHECLFCVSGTSFNCRHSFDYSDKDETVIVHLVGNIDAFIKIAHSWPVSTSPLKLVSLKNSDFHSKGISLSLICKIQVSSAGFMLVF